MDIRHPMPYLTDDIKTTIMDWRRNSAKLSQTSITSPVRGKSLDIIRQTAMALVYLNTHATWSENVEADLINL